MRIHSVKITNFKSCYGTQEFIFDDLQGLVKLSGPIGSGKTLLCEAMQWGLLGTVKGQTNPSLIAWNTDACEVEINLTSKNKEIYIRRNIREPLVVEVDGKSLMASNKRNAQTILEEDLYDVPKLAILKMCLISFNGFSSIADMNPGQTKEFIDEIFGFKLFTEYNQIVQEEKKIIQNNVIKLSALHDENTNQINALLEKKRQQQIQLDENFNLVGLKEERSELVNQGKSKKEEYIRIDNNYKDEEKILNDERLEHFRKKNEYKTLGKQKKDYITTFKEGKCPTCNHEVDPSILEEHRVQMLKYADLYKEEDAKELEVNSRLQTKQQEHQAELTVLANEMQDLKNKINKIDSDIAIYNNNVKMINENYDDLIKDCQTKIDDVKRELELSDKEITEWLELEELLTKSLRYKLLDTLIPHINKSIAFFINRLEQPYRIEFDQEFKAHIFAESFDREIAYNNLSTGQKKTVDIAIVFGILQNVISNVDMNVLVMDELMSNMDSDARNIMLSVLKETMGEDKSIFIVNHAEMNDDYFDHKIRVSLKNYKVRVQLKKKDEPKDVIVRASNYEKIF
jgi:DNA repair exonuclease SbcCD ATPase subunit